MDSEEDTEVGTQDSALHPSEDGELADRRAEMGEELYRRSAKPLRDGRAPHPLISVQELVDVITARPWLPQRSVRRRPNGEASIAGHEGPAAEEASVQAAPTSTAPGGSASGADGPRHMETGDGADGGGEDEEEVNDQAVLGPRKRKELHEEAMTKMNHHTLEKYGSQGGHFVVWCQGHDPPLYPLPHTEIIVNYLNQRRTGGVPGTHTRALKTIPSFEGTAAALATIQKWVRQRFGVGNNELGIPLAEHLSYQQIKRLVQADVHDRDKRGETDPLKNTAGDVLTPEEYKLVCDNLHAKGPTNRQAMKYAAMIKVARGGMYRFDDVRQMKLGYMCLQKISLNNIGPDLCTVLTIVSRGGKTNHHGRADYGQLFRGREAEYCAQGALALWFWAR